MIFNSGSPLSPKVSLELNNSEIDYLTISSIEFDACINEHDTLIIYVNGIPSRAITDYIDVPVRFSVSSGTGRSQGFVGYVMYVEPHYNSSDPIINQTVFQSAKLVCFGASVVMKSTHSRVWGSTTIYRIAQEIASKYRFSLSVFKDDFVIRNAVQSNESDWEFLIRLCNTYGYSMWVNETHISIWDPFQAIARRPSFERLIPQNEYSGVTPGSILKFEGTFGHLTTEGESYKYQVASMDDSGVINMVSDPDDGRVQSWSGYGETPLYTSTITDIATSLGEAEKLRDAERKKHFAFNAHAKIVSGAGIVPGGIVDVSGYNSNFDGLWYVKSVKHTIGNSSYYTELSIGKDYNLSGNYLVPPVALATRPPDSAFVDNTWVASQQEVTLYV